jgi:hypothetical protein
LQRPGVRLATRPVLSLRAVVSRRPTSLRLIALGLVGAGEWARLDG